MDKLNILYSQVRSKRVTPEKLTEIVSSDDTNVSLAGLAVLNPNADASTYEAYIKRFTVELPSKKAERGLITNGLVAIARKQNITQDVLSKLLDVSVTPVKKKLFCTGLGSLLSRNLTVIDMGFREACLMFASGEQKDGLLFNKETYDKAIQQVNKLGLSKHLGPV